MSNLTIDRSRLLGRIQELGDIGRDSDGRLARVAGTDADKLGRDRFVAWLREVGLDIAVDRIGNIFGIWHDAANRDRAPIMIGSHIDTVVNAGIFDGCYGVLAGLDVIQTLRATGLPTARPIVVGAFTNEEGARYAPDMMGSLVYAGGLDLTEALTTSGTDGSVLGAELERIGYAGTETPGFLKPHAYVELHIEQGPVLERRALQIGAVENLQGISWQRVTIEGTANHAGTTPMSMRCDAGQAAARVITYLHDRATASKTPTVATVGSIAFRPNVVNVIPSRAIFTVDLRDPDDDRLREEEQALARYLDELTANTGARVSVERLVRFEPVAFNAAIVEIIEDAAEKRGLSTCRMTSGAGHDAQMIARIAPAAMIFVPSKAGISHNPREYTTDDELVNGANVLLDVVTRLANAT